MTDPDYRQMEEIESQRLERTLAALTRVALGVSNYTDAFFLAAELGVRNLWPLDLRALATKNELGTNWETSDTWHGKAGEPATRKGG